MECTVEVSRPQHFRKAHIEDTKRTANEFDALPGDIMLT